jgi:hypothetical protein
MSNDCRNDCVPPLTFPLRIQNRAGLDHINFRIGNYADIREALLRNLDKDPTLSAWTYRGADDPGIALLEGAAILGDVLTFYQELYANEAYLRTAHWRESISDLVRLLGYRLSPGLGGQATFAFEVKGTKAVVVPENFPLKAEVTGLAKPADFETSEALTAYPWLSRFNLFRPLSWPNVSPSTTEFFIETPDTSVSPVALKQGDRLIIGDAAPWSSLQLSNAEVVIVDSTRVLHGQTLIKIKGALKRSSSIATVKAFKLGRTFHHFGYNGPQKIINPPAAATATITGAPPTSITTNIPAPTETSISFSRRLDITTDTSGTRTVVPALSPNEFPLDAELQDLPTGVPFVIQAHVTAWVSVPPYPSPPLKSVDVTVVSTIADVKSVSATWGLLSATTSIVTLDDSIVLPFSFSNMSDIRTFLFHETLSPKLTLRAAPVEDTARLKGDNLLFLGTDAQAQSLKGRRLFFAPPGKEAFIASVTAVETEPSPSLEPRARVRRITIDKSVDYVDFPNEKPVVIVYGNLADATQGKTEAEAAIGTGDSRQTFQTFKVPKAPLTYLISKGNSPPETPELQIYVNQRLWKLVPTFFGRRYDEEIYIVREDEAGDTWVQFGDGKTGARLSSGVKNVTAKYRTGTGVYGPLKPDKKVQGGARVDGLDKIQMPGVSAGGSAPEDGDNAREAAPPKFQSLDRLVSLADFESEALAISGVTRATSSWQIEANVPAVFITVLMESGREEEISAVEEVIAGYNLCRGPHRLPVIIREGRLLYVSVNVTYALDPTFREDVVTGAIQQALGAANLPPAIDTQSTSDGTGRRGLFSLRRRRFGEVEYAKRIAGTVQNVAGVVWVEVNSFQSLGEAFEPQFDPNGLPIDPATIALPATQTFNERVACDSLHILALHSRHLTITATADPSKGVCS